MTSCKAFLSLAFDDLMNSEEMVSWGTYKKSWFTPAIPSFELRAVQVALTLVTLRPVMTEIFSTLVMPATKALAFSKAAVAMPRSTNYRLFIGCLPYVKSFSTYWFHLPISEREVSPKHRWYPFHLQSSCSQPRWWQPSTGPRGRGSFQLPSS